MYFFFFDGFTRGQVRMIKCRGVVWTPNSWFNKTKKSRGVDKDFFGLISTLI